MMPILPARAPDTAPISRPNRGAAEDQNKAFGALVDQPQQTDNSEASDSELAETERPRSWAILFPALEGFAAAEELTREQSDKISDKDALQPKGDDEPTEKSLLAAILVNSLVAAELANVPDQVGGAAKTPAGSTAIIDPSLAILPEAQAASSRVAAEVKPFAATQDASTKPDANSGEAAKPAPTEVLTAQTRALAAPAAAEPTSLHAARTQPNDEAPNSDGTPPEPQVGTLATAAPSSGNASATPTPLPGPVALALDPVTQPALVQSARRVTEAELNQLAPDKTTETLRLQLKPIDLGAVTAVLHSAGGILSIHLQVESAEAHHRLTHEKDAIGKALRELGLEVESVSVQHTIATTSAGNRDGSSMQSNGSNSNGPMARNDGNDAGQSGNPSRQLPKRESDDGKGSRPNAALAADDRLQPGHYI